MNRRLLIACSLGLPALACTSTPREGDPIAGLTPEQLDAFERGRAVFERVFTPESGLGPLFNAQSCLECHSDPVTGGASLQDELHASSVTADLAHAAHALEVGAHALEDAAHALEDAAPPLPQRPQLPIPVSYANTEAHVAAQRHNPRATCDLLFALGGPVYQQQTTPALREALGIDREPIPAGAALATRSAPDLFGFGLLDTVTDSTLLALADPDDADGDGISGRVNRFLDGRIGRFGRKAFVPSLAEFNAGAFQIEQGVTVPEVPDEGSVGGIPLPPGVDPLPEPELDAESVRAVQAFVRFLAPPPRIKPDARARRGADVFARIQCAACHVPALPTGPSDAAALAHRDVAAYTDLLLHDMGASLADICFGDAAPNEFRTEPLMGLRFAARYLHDGRATTLEDAIRLHGGEAARARDAFAALSDRDRTALLAFLRTL